VQGRKAVKKQTSSHSSPSTAKIETLFMECKQQVYNMLVRANNRNKHEQTICHNTTTTEEHGAGGGTKEKVSALHFCFCKGFGQVFKYELV